MCWKDSGEKHDADEPCEQIRYLKSYKFIIHEFPACANKMKKLSVLVLALALLTLPVLALAEAFNPAGFIDWFNESNTWMTVANGHWSADPADATSAATAEAK